MSDELARLRMKAMRRRKREAGIRSVTVEAASDDDVARIREFAVTLLREAQARADAPKP